MNALYELLFLMLLLLGHQIQALTERSCETTIPSRKYDCLFLSKENKPCCYLNYLQHATQHSTCFSMDYRSADELIQSIETQKKQLPANVGSVQLSCGMIFEQCPSIEKPSQKADCNRVKIEIPYNCCLIVKPNGEKSCYPVDRNDIGSFAALYQARENLTESPSIICQGCLLAMSKLVLSMLIVFLLL